MYRAVLALAVLFFCTSTRAELPIVGQDLPSLSLLDDAMVNVMESNDISAGTLAVMRNGVPIYHKAFGWQDQARTQTVPLNTMMRLASVTKPLTAAAIRKLAGEQLLDLNDQVFSVDTPGSGILDLSPFGAPDSRLDQITVDHLIHHQGGWDKDAPGIPDYTYQEVSIAIQMGISSPPSRADVMRYIMGRPLQFTPGTDNAYANTGYLALGLVSEAASGLDHIDVIREKVLAPIGIAPELVAHGRTHAINQEETEPYYDSNGSTSTNVYNPFGSSVPSAYGGFNVEARIGQGGVVAHPLAILEFADHYDLGGSNIGGPRGGGTWIFNGAYTGTNTQAVQRGDGINYVVLFNKRDGISEIGSELSNIFNNNLITEWPTEDISQHSFLNGIDGDLNQDSLVNSLDIDLFVQGWLANTSQMTVAESYSKGDMDLNGITDLRDANALHEALIAVGQGGLDYSRIAGVPEPSSILLAMLCFLGLVCRFRSAGSTNAAYFCTQTS